jgi:hypothetical protein
LNNEVKTDSIKIFKFILEKVVILKRFMFNMQSTKRLTLIAFIKEKKKTGKEGLKIADK